MAGKLIFLRFLLTLFLLVSGVLSHAQKPFTDITAPAGINHQFLVKEGMFGGGACVLDVNNDGWEDVYITSGMGEDMLYLNSGRGSFTNILPGSGLELTGAYVTQGVSSADINKDGWTDLIVTTIAIKDTAQIIPRAINLLFLNLGNNRFKDVTTAYGLDKQHTFSTAASFGDINADGFPDLFIANYFNEYDGPLSSINDATVVGANMIAADQLFLNRKGKFFSEAYERYGLSYRGFGFGGVFSDYDGDGDLDIIVNNDFGYKRTPNLLLENQFPRSKFVDRGPDTGLDLMINSMGTAIGDINADGYPDYFFTNIRFNRFMVSQGPGKPYLDKLKELGMSFMTISWGANFCDFDHDGDEDLFVANGDLNPNCVPMADFYFENQGGRFIDRSAAVGLNDYGIGRGSVIFDFDHDGDVDILVVNQKPVLDYPVASITHLFRNDSAQGHWLKVALQGVQSDFHGLGSRVEIITGGKKQFREIDGGSSSHLSQNSPQLHFGLGASNTVDSLIVTWVGGKKQILTAIPANQLLQVIETEVPVRHLPWVYLAVGILSISLAVWYFLRRAKHMTS